MALSGQTGWVGFWDNSHKYYLTWAATTDASNNQSTVIVKWMLILEWNAGTWGTVNSGVRPWTITCGGQTKNGTYPKGVTLSVNNTYTLVTQTFVLSHNSDGTLTFNLSGTFDTPGGGGIAKITNVPFTLDPIPQGRVYTKVGSNIVSGQVYIKVGSTIYQAKDVYIGITGNIPKKAIV